ncbi:MAG: Hsp33 family molecular chaperone HslO [Myxococcota bacterium]
MTDESARGVVVRALVAGRAVRVLITEARPLVERTRAIHGLGPDATRIGGEAIVAGLLSSIQIKGEEQLTLQIQGVEPKCAVYVDVTATGGLRARVRPADLVLGERVRGMLLVIKHAPGSQTYRGASEIDGATLEQGLAAHFTSSAQVDAILRVGCVVGPDGRVVSAGGLSIERLPEERGLPSLTLAEFHERFGWVKDADLGQLLTQAAFGSLGDERLEVLERLDVAWKCRCSEAKIEETLSSLGVAQLEVLIHEDHGAEVSCHFCGTVYRVSEARLRELAASADG